jgi:hypothetical protein
VKHKYILVYRTGLNEPELGTLEIASAFDIEQTSGQLMKHGHLELLPGGKRIIMPAAMVCLTEAE